MMGEGRFTDVFKLDAIKQIPEHGYAEADVLHRLGAKHIFILSLDALLYAPEKAAMQEDELSRDQAA